MTEEDFDEEEFIDYYVVLTDENGSSIVSDQPKKIFPSWKTELYKTDSIFNECLYKHPFSTVILDSSEFVYNSDFDMSSVKRIEIVLKDRERTIQIDDIGLYTGETESDK